ncbi:site-specific DNA-methyltransferase [Pseudomonas sp. WS 5503]|uniref:site-specific DNA-methyltransferase n=1 Tax=Pseudomonas sp. WS 5503 TaxID=2717497 RepID=UPI001473B9D2|nr:site-specific DNA-methyltransferase [Pseudomonas sp. WS 5503]NMX79884.1 site-specific DNA-methyltransferase [Pseudomonas sp. WS 5503]
MNSIHLKSRIVEIAKNLGISDHQLPLELSNPPVAHLAEEQCTLIKADNLTALSWLLDQNKRDIDFCYIDPPYNTGSTFVYHDKRQAKSASIWSKHHDWLAFMLPRLVATQLLLADDGVIAISIDDYEYPYLKILMDSVFGENNYIATLVVCRSKNGKGSKANVAVNHEYVLLYGKSEQSTLRGVEDQDLEKYNKEDEHGRFTIDGLFRKKGDASKREDRPNMFYPLYYSQDGKVYASKISEDLREAWPVDSKGAERRWLWGPEKAQSESWKLYASPKGVIYVKNYSAPNKRIKIRSILDKPEYLNDRASREVKSIFGERVFETPKPINLIMDLIDCCSSPEATVLDYFAGTGTTAHACHLLNKNKSANRKCILVEHNHFINKSHTANAAGFKTTADITEFRLNKLSEDDQSFNFSTQEIE